MTTTKQWSAKKAGDSFSVEVTKTTVDNNLPTIETRIRDIRPTTRNQSPFTGAVGVVSAYNIEQTRELASLIAWAAEEAEK